MYSTSHSYYRLRDSIIFKRCFLRWQVADLTPFKEPKKLVKLTGSAEEFSTMNIRIARTMSVWHARRHLAETAKRSVMFYRNWGFEV